MTRRKIALAIYFFRYFLPNVCMHKMWESMIQVLGGQNMSDLNFFCSTLISTLYTSVLFAVKSISQWIFCYSISDETVSTFGSLGAVMGENHRGNITSFTCRSVIPVPELQNIFSPSKMTPSAQNILPAPKHPNLSPTFANGSPRVV